MSPLKPHIKQLLFIVLAVCLSGQALARTVYINDQLRVGIRPEPNNDSTPITVVSTGDKLELLDSDSGYVLVRTQNGLEGWVKEIYTTTNVPAVVQLKSLSESAGGSSVKIQELSKKIDLMESANRVLNEQLEELKGEKSKYQLELLAMQSGQASGGWVYWLVGILVFAVGSFVMGMFWYRNQAMKRLGGLRIYF